MPGGYYFKTRDAKIKAIAVPSAFSAMLGITEAALFGINLRFVKPFLAALAGGALGGALGGGQPRRHERDRPNGDPRHGDRAGQFRWSAISSAWRSHLAAPSCSPCC